MKWILILGLNLIVGCNALQTIADGKTKIPKDFNEGLGSGSTPDLTSGLVSFWNFNSADNTNPGGGTTNVSDFNNVNPLAIGLSGTPATSGAAIESTPSKVLSGQSLRCLFAGVVQNASATFNFGSNTNFTIAMWLRFDAAPDSAAYVMEIKDASSVHHLFITFDGGDNLLLEIKNNNATMDTIAIPINYTSNLNKWNHFVFVTDRSNSITAYLNGSLSSQSAITTNGYMYNFNKLGLCEFAPAIFAGTYTGYLDSIGIWNKTLTENEVSTLYNGNHQLD